MLVFKVRQAPSQLGLWKPTQRKSDRPGVTPLLFTQHIYLSLWTDLNSHKASFDHFTAIKIIRMLWILKPGRQTHIISVGALWKPKQTLRVKQPLLHQMQKCPHLPDQHSLHVQSCWTIIRSQLRSHSSMTKHTPPSKRCAKEILKSKYKDGGELLLNCYSPLFVNLNETGSQSASVQDGRFHSRLQ